MRVARYGRDGMPDSEGRTDVYDLKLESDPMKPVPPVKRLDGALAQRLVTVAKQFLAADSSQRLDDHERALMCGEVLARRGAVLSREHSDVYVAERYRLLFEPASRKDAEHVGGWVSPGAGATDPNVPADGMAAGSVVASEVQGKAKQMRTRVNAYLNRARSELSAGSLRSQMPNPGDVEARAYELAQQDPEGKFK